MGRETDWEIFIINALLKLLELTGNCINLPFDHIRTQLKSSLFRHLRHFLLIPWDASEEKVHFTDQTVMELSHAQNFPFLSNKILAFQMAYPSSVRRRQSYSALLTLWPHYISLPLVHTESV